jgi:hypothetical protein
LKETCRISKKNGVDEGSSGQDISRVEADGYCMLSWSIERPSSVLGDKTPQEVWTGKEPSLTHLKVFGAMHMFMFQRKTGVS